MNHCTPDSTAIIDGFLAKYHPEAQGVAVVALSPRLAMWANKEERAETFPGLTEAELEAAYLAVRFMPTLEAAILLRAKLLEKGLLIVLVMINDGAKWRLPE